jgi:hypothetical protein
MIGLRIKLDKKKFIEYINKNINNTFELTFTPYNDGKRLEIIIDLDINNENKQLFEQSIKENEYRIINK